MADSLRILGLLLRKNLLVRKRLWMLSLFGEVLVPVALIICSWAAWNLAAEPPVKIENDTYYMTVSKDDMIKSTRWSDSVVYFAPNNSFTKSLMQETGLCLHNAPIYEYTSEEELIQNYQRNETVYGTYRRSIAVIFDDKNIDNSTKHLKYKIRSTNLAELDLYNVFPPQNITYYYTERNTFIQLQICLDESFIKIKAKDTTFNPEIFVQQLPYPPYVKQDLTDEVLRQLFSAFVVLAFLIPLFLETENASNEKFLGINVLMTMNGVSNTLNLLSWILNGFFFLSIFFVAPIIIVLLFSTGDALPYLCYSNPFIIWLVFTIHVVHLLTYGIHVSAYFTRPSLVLFGIVIIYTAAMVLQLYGLNKDTYSIAPYLGILFPNLLLFRAVEELNYYETIAEGVQWDNLFIVGNAAYKLGGCTGMILIFSTLGLIFHFLMAIYLYSVNPGKYGVKKHPLFFLKIKSKTHTGDMENLEYNNIDGRHFESTPEEVYTPGIQIRNLKKAYNISLFNKTKVHALRGVSIDFFKGQITSLLGHNGAGKTTMMSILTGMMSPTEGLVHINSKDIKAHAKEIMDEMGVCPQENMLFPYLTVSEQIGFLALLKGKGKNRAAIKQNVKILLEKINLYEKRNTLPQNLSDGEKRRLCLGMAIVGDPSILILDEPTSGLDPESKRIIWDILLKMREQKTILISTHDMVEADILGDRIAILHTGQLRGYGTSMFLKRLLGEGNVEVTLSVEPGCDPDRILYELDCQGKISNADGNKLVISVPNSPDLPDSLDKIERKKKELGVSGFTLSPISLEQVLLKVTQDDDNPIKTRQPSSRNDRKLTGGRLYMQFVRALLLKKMTYTIKNMLNIILMLILVLVALLSISFILKQTNISKLTTNIKDIRLDMYTQPKTYYKSDNTTFGQKYTLLTENLFGKAVQIGDSSLSEALLKYAKQDLSFYDNHLIAAAEFNETDNGIAVNALYSEKASYSFPISVNLLSNAIAKTLLGDDYLISVSSQQLPSLETLIYNDRAEINGFTIAVIFSFLFIPCIALFVLHPFRESATNVKELQRMTGVSCFTYWGTMFIFDLIVFLLMIVIIIVGFICMDSALELGIYGETEILITLLLLVLLAINSLPLVYIFTFFRVSKSAIVQLLIYIPLGLVAVEVVMYAVNAAHQVYQSVRIIRSIQKGVFLLIPYISFLHSQISFYWTVQTNARCKNMPNDFYDDVCSIPTRHDICCKLGCYDGECKNYVEYFTDFEGDVTLEESLIYLCVTPILYFGILATLEYKLIQTLMVGLRKQHPPEYSTDEQVKREKAIIAEKISALRGYDVNSINNKVLNRKTETSLNTVQEHSLNNSKKDIFLVYELRKQCGKFLAVQDISFGVNQRECFGLLEVNGAGKSAVFRMMTGGEVPDNGIMYIGDKDIKQNRKYFFSQMGYCPQNDAIIKSLNAYDHLQLFARLRGIPEDQVKVEVNTWIQRLNLKACAAQPSGTYSSGNKRRLNIAIAFIGTPNLVLLDEPTTGVDPGVRRCLWNVIQSCQTSGQAVVLTSNSMEECEALCSRLAIMVGGRFVCIGSLQELKQRFGAGYDIQIKMNPEKVKDQIDGIKSDIIKALSCEVVNENLGYLTYHVTATEITWRKMYDVMYVIKSKYDCIHDFSVLSSTLEHLFARAANNSPKTE